MSAWSDWRVGAITDDEYSYACWREDAMDRALVEKEWAEPFDGVIEDE